MLDDFVNTICKAKTSQPLTSAQIIPNAMTSYKVDTLQKKMGSQQKFNTVEVF